MFESEDSSYYHCRIIAFDYVLGSSDLNISRTERYPFLNLTISECTEGVRRSKSLSKEFFSKNPNFSAI